MLVTLIVDVAHRFDLLQGTTGIIIFPLNTLTFFLLGHLAFDHWIWRRRFIQKFLGVPDLNGRWRCDGQTKDSEGNTQYTWTAEVTITQTWEKICIHLQTTQSASTSKAASLIKVPGRGYLLMYSYRNDPRIGEADLHSHMGYCELELNETLDTAEGDYFNNKGRITFGRMKLTREKP